ncbi:MAG: hypothetical protein HKM23_02195 [Nitrosopumilus sp.]|nr:hypothetical protein [Nitrosopumilus sp.]
MSKTSLQYYCESCQNILSESNFESDISSSVEPCPFCGVVLSQALQKRFSRPVTKPAVVFKKASSLPKLTLDIQKLDGLFHFLTLNDKLSISGIQTQKIIERICVRAQLPSRYGGLNSKVLLVDGANSSDLYQCVDFAQQYGLNVNKILDGVISSRAFTVYQLANTVIAELPNIVKKHDVKIVIITNLLYYFTNDLRLDTNEMKMILKEIIKTLNKIQDCLVVVSLGMPSRYDCLFSQLFSRTIRIQQSYGPLSLSVNNNGKKNSILLKKEELETIPRH